MSQFYFQISDPPTFLHSLYPHHSKHHHYPLFNKVGNLKSCTPSHQFHSRAPLIYSPQNRENDFLKTCISVMQLLLILKKRRHSKFLPWSTGHTWSSPCQISKVTPAFLPFLYFAQVFHLLEMKTPNSFHLGYLYCHFLNQEYLSGFPSFCDSLSWFRSKSARRQLPPNFPV